MSRISENLYKAVSLASDERVVNSLEKLGAIRFDVSWTIHFIFIFIFIYLCRVKYAAIEADLYTALPNQKLNNLLTVI